MTCACGRPVADAAVCSSCAQAVARDLGDVAELCAELDVMLARLSVFGNRAAARSSSAPLPYDQRASEASYVLRNTLASMARLVAEERGVPEPVAPVRATGGRTVGNPTLAPVPTPLVASWLLGHVEWLRHHEAAEELLDEVRSAVREVRHVVDRPADRWYAGQCGDGICVEDLYAKVGATVVACRACGAEYDVEARRSWLRDAVEDVLANATEIARALTSLAMPVTSSSIRGYANRKRLEERGRDLAGRPTYRVGDVLDLLVADRASGGRKSGLGRNGTGRTSARDDAGLVQESGRGA